MIPTQSPAPIQTMPKPAEKSFQLPLKPTDKIGPIAGPELQLPVPVAKLADQDLLGKKLVNPQGVSLGYIMAVNRDDKGAITSLGLQPSQRLENRALPYLKSKLHLQNKQRAAEAAPAFGAQRRLFRRFAAPD